MEEELRNEKGSPSKEQTSSSPKLSLDIPLPVECPTSQPSSISTSASLTKPSVLGIQNAKKRLKGFFIAKKALEAKSVDGEFGIIKNNQILTSKKQESATEKKKSKKGLTPSEKAKATITEIEEIKRKEALRNLLYAKQQPYLKEYGYRNPSSDRRDSYRNRSWRYNSRRYSRERSRNRFENTRNDFRSRSPSRHKSSTRNSENRRERNRRNERSERQNVKEKKDEKSNRKNEKKIDKEETIKKDVFEKKNKNDEKKSSLKKTPSPEKRKVDLVDATKNKHDEFKIASITSYEDSEELSKSFTDSNITINNHKIDVSKSDLSSQKSSSTSEEVLTKIEVKLNSKLPAICAYNSDSDSVNIQDVIESSKCSYDSAIEKKDVDSLDQHSSQLSFMSNTIVSPQLSQTSSTSKKGCKSNSDFILDTTFDDIKKDPYARFIRHPNIFNRYTTAQPILSYSENPAYRNLSRNWYSHYEDCLKSQSLSPKGNDPPKLFEEILATENNTIDMGDYDTSKNDISNRELAMNSEPPSVIQSNDLNTEYEEFIRAVNVENSKIDEIDDLGLAKKCEDDEGVSNIDLIQFIKEKSIEKSNIKNKKIVTKKILSKLSKKYHSYSNDYSTSSDSSESSNSSSSDSNSSSDSSTDSSSDGESGSLSSSSSSNSLRNKTSSKKQKSHNKQSAVSKPIIDVNVIPLPLIIKQEKEVDLKANQHIFNPNIKIKQEPIDISSSEKTQTPEVNTMEENGFHDKLEKNLEQPKFLNYGGESFQVLDWEESSQSYDGHAAQENIVTTKNVNNIHDIPLPQVVTDNLLEKVTCENDLNEKNNTNSCISFKLPSNNKRNLKAISINEDMHGEAGQPEDVIKNYEDQNLQNKEFTDGDIENNKSNYDEDNERKSRYSSKSSTRSSSKSSERSSRRSLSPRNNKYLSEKSHYDRIYSDQSKYKDHQNNSPRANKYDDDFYENHSYEQAIPSNKNNHINEHYDKNDVNVDYDFSYKQSDYCDKINDEESYANSLDLLCINTEPKENSHYSINNDYVIKPDILQKEINTETSLTPAFLSKTSEKMDLDNIPLPSQDNNFSESTEVSVPSVIPTLMSTKKNYNKNITHSNADEGYECDYYNDHYNERRNFVSSPKRISLDARINMVLGLSESKTDDHNSQHAVNYNSSNYSQNYCDHNQYNGSVSGNINDYLPEAPVDYIQTIHTYPQQTIQAPKRRAQTANLVNVVLTDSVNKIVEPVEIIKSPIVPKVKEKSPVKVICSKPTVPTFSSGIFDCITKIVKLGGPLLILPPDVAKIESREIFEQIENFIQDENNQKRFKTPIPKPDIKQFQNNWYQQDKYINSSEGNIVGSSDLGSSGKGILTNSYFRKDWGNFGRRSNSRKVKFADGVLPGEGTSTSGGEEMMSPPPPGVDPKAKRKRKKAKKIRKNDSFDGFGNLPPPPPPEDDPPSFLLQPCDIAENAALGFTDIPKALERFSIFFNSALSRKSECFAGDVIGS